MKLGSAFSDSLIIEHKTKTTLSKREESAWWLGAGRALLFTTILFISLFILIWRLFDLTVIHGHLYRSFADENRTRELTRHAPRGDILDRAGNPLTVNVPTYRLLKPCEKSQSASCVSVLTQAEGEELQKKPMPVGWFLEVDYQRQYVAGPAASHVVGYTGEISGDELKDPYYLLHNYRFADPIGRMGAEAVFEDKLRGRDGHELIEVDAGGKTVRTLGTDPETPGETVYLSIDRALSQSVEQSFPSDFKGAVVISKPSTGEILALYSSPSFDPNAFSRGLTQNEYREYFEADDRPLLNRAIGGVYPPGSTFKIVTAIAGLEEGVVRSDTTIEDTGILRAGEFSFGNWYFLQYGKTEGIVDIVKAIQRSNDIFFYKVGEWLGIRKLADWAHKLGIGAPLGIELSGEAGGLMPDPAWKRDHFRSPADLEARDNLWYLGDMYHVAIGQGYLLTTPLQVNAWTNVIASGGKLCRPTIKKMTSDQRQATRNCKDLGIKKETIDLITQGMTKACESGGTGWPFFDFTVSRRRILSETKDPPDAARDPIAPTNTSGLQDDVKVPVACKTGTSEFGDPNNRTHAWFTVFAPVTFKGETLQGVDSNEVVTGEPEISVTVLVEGGGEGSNVAAPIAKKILEAWFGR